MKQLYSKQAIARQTARIGTEISRDYQGLEIILVVVLKGAMFFAADLARTINNDVNVKIDFIRVSSYGTSTESCGVVTFKTDIETDISGKHVVLVEDILDSGLTLFELQKHLQKRQPASLKVCTLFDKPGNRVVAINPDYCGFSIKNDFIIGYGLDYAERYRNLSAVYRFDPEQHQSTTGES